MITFKLFNTGFCSAPEKLAMRSASWRPFAFPALFAYIEHSTFGNILFDTGHSHRFFDETSRFPLQIYRWLTRVTHLPHQDAASQLRAFGVDPADINHIVISHFHADHIGSLRDFPNATFIYLKKAYEAVHGLNRFLALKAGFLPGLIPHDFKRRSSFLDERPLLPLSPSYFPFRFGYSLFNDDDRIIAVELPGHAEGQVGLFLHVSEEQKVFLVADACWNSLAYLNLTPPHPLSFLIMANQSKYQETLVNIHTLNKQSPHIKIIPSHCRSTWEKTALEN